MAVVEDHNYQKLFIQLANRELDVDPNLLLCQEFWASP